jgi:predicted AlkP superfamily pyrophosphatase or phosphodiesterase
MESYMLDLSNEILPKLKNHHIEGINTGKNSILPYYQGLSLVNIPNSICQFLGAEPFGAPPLNPQLMDTLGGPYENIIYLLADGVRLNFFQSFLKKAPWNELASDSIFSPLTSITPSTTSAALTTIWTGAYPAEHGILGYEVWLREYGMIANMILHSAFTFQGDNGGLQRAGFDPLTFLPVPTIGPHLLKNGIQPFALQNISIAYSGLSQMLFPGVEVIPFRNNGDFFVSLEQLMERQQGRSTYAYAYWESIDTLSHRFGPNDVRNTREFELFSLGLIATLKRIREKSKGKTLFIMTSDHGHIYTPILDRYDLTRYPDINRHLVMVPTGENRLPYLIPRSGSYEKVIELFKYHFNEDFIAIPSKDAITHGLFGGGKHHKMLEDRLGEWILVPQNDAYLWWWWQKENPLLGRHGGLSPEEMLVPFFAVVL